MFEGGVSAVQTAVPALLAALTTLIGVIKVNNKSGRLRGQIKDALELSKLADESKASAVKEKLDTLIGDQVDRLRDLEQKNADRQYSGSTLGGALVVAVPLGSFAWLFFTLPWAPGPFAAWACVVLACIVLIIGVVGFFSPSNRKA